MKKFLFELITSPFSLFDNPIYDYIVMAIIGYVAYKVAFGAVGNLGLRGEIGSIVHWIIRLIVLMFIWMICCIIIWIVKLIVNNWIVVTISAILLLILYILKLYAKNNPKCILNRKVF